MNGTIKFTIGGCMMVISGISEKMVTARVAMINNVIINRDRVAADAGC